MRYEISLEAIICDDDCTDEQIGEIYGDVMEALVDGGLNDPFVGGSVKERRMEVTIVVEASSDGAAVETGRKLIAAALTRAGFELKNERVAVPPSLSWSSTSIRPAV